MTRRTWLVSTVVAGAAAASLAGCGPQNQIATTTPDEKVSSGTTAASTSSATASVAPEAAAILKQYRAFYEVGVPAAYKNPKQAQAELAPYATGAQLKTSADAIYAQYLAGYEARGRAVLNPVVVKVAAPTAEVHDCQACRTRSAASRRPRGP